MTPDPSDSKPEPTSSPSPGWEIFDRIRQSEGERIYWEQESLRASYVVFSKNYEALRAVIEGFENPDNGSRFLSIGKRQLLKLIQLENMRHLHNFLAGASTLIDHTRVMVRRLYANHPFQHEYQAKRAEIFNGTGPAGLVKGLRNWMVHKGIVPVVIVTTFEPRTTSSIVLNIKELRLYDGWDGQTKAFLSSCDSDPRLLNIVESYHAKVEHLYTWLGERMSQIHSAAFTELAELQDEYRRVSGMRA
jgi:hypothetical protein